MKSKLSLKKMLWGAGIAAMLSIITAIVTFSQAGQFPTTWDGVSGWGTPIYVMIAAFIAYLIKCIISGDYPNAELFMVNLKDVLKGAIIAAGTSIGTAIVTFAQAGTFPLFWTKLDELGNIVHGWDLPIYAMIAVFGLYILKNYVTNSQGKFAKEPAK